MTAFVCVCVAVSNGNIARAGDQQSPTPAQGLEWNFIGLDNTRVYSLDQVGSMLFAATGDGLYHKDLASEAEWARLGLAGLLVVDIYTDPLVTDTMYCAMAVRNLPEEPPPVTVYKSTDGGTTWLPADSGLPAHSVRTIEGRPDNPNALFITTKYPSPLSLYRSENGGSSWTALMDSTDRLTAVAISRGEPSVLYANAPPEGELFSILKSGDGGQTWATIFEGRHDFEGSISRALAIDPTDPDVVYVGVGQFIYTTHDGGSLFNEHRVPGGFSYAFHAISIDPNQPARVYAGGGFDGFPLVFRSEDAGDSWAEIPGPDDRGSVYSMILERNEGQTLFVGTAKGMYSIELPDHNSVDPDISLLYE